MHAAPRVATAVAQRRVPPPSNAVAQVVQVCDALVAAVAPTFGPAGSDAMLVSAVNSVLITSSGASVLAALQVEHPLARVVLDAALEHGRHCGDGSTRMVLCLSRALHELARCARVSTEQPGASHGALGARRSGQATAGSAGDTDTRRQLMQLSRAFAALQARFCDAVLRECLGGGATATETPATGSDPAKWTRMGALLRDIRSLAATQLAGAFSRSAVESLCTLLVKWIRACTPAKADAAAARMRLRTVCAVVERLVDEFPVIEVPRASLSSSTVVADGVLVRGSLVRAHLLPGSRKLSDVQVAVFTCSVEASGPASGRVSTTGATAAVEVTSAAQLSTALSFKSVRVGSMVRALRERGVKVVMSTHPVPDYFGQMCEDHGMVGVEAVEDADVERLCHAAGVSPLRDCHERTVQFAPLVHAMSVDRVKLGPVGCVRLCVSAGASPSGSAGSGSRERGGDVSSGSRAANNAGGTAFERPSSADGVADTDGTTHVRSKETDEAWGSAAQSCRQLVLCGASAGIATQFALAVRRVLRMLAFWLRDRLTAELEAGGEDSMGCIGSGCVSGGGAPELRCALVCDDLARVCDSQGAARAAGSAAAPADSKAPAVRSVTAARAFSDVLVDGLVSPTVMSMALRVLKEGLLAVPFALARSSEGASSSADAFGGASGAGAASIVDSFDRGRGGGSGSGDAFGGGRVSGGATGLPVTGPAGQAQSQSRRMLAAWPQLASLWRLPVDGTRPDAGGSDVLWSLGMLGVAVPGCPGVARDGAGAVAFGGLLFADLGCDGSESVAGDGARGDDRDGDRVLEPAAQCLALVDALCAVLRQMCRLSHVVGVRAKARGARELRSEATHGSARGGNGGRDHDRDSDDDDA